MRFFKLNEKQTYLDQSPDPADQVCLHIKAPAEAIQALDGAQANYKKLKDSWAGFSPDRKNGLSLEQLRRWFQDSTLFPFSVV